MTNLMSQKEEADLVLEQISDDYFWVEKNRFGNIGYLINRNEMDDMVEVFNNPLIYKESKERLN
ncbi:hypothetical protein [Oceanobacillus kimchii]|uniref:Uncharacterized protein n=1 Tax=Oceanobacillus kimchii TaxID=746691 RepID=A0ABQ5TJS9_9BACI|nr:hypothetical protein [Oceanobacillus kimchii]GLO66255.1 hypothetical protein MACH08_20390 [Oceanobacillus kimchii]